MMAAVTLDRSALFADIAGSTRLVVEKGDDAARVLMLRYIGVLADTARANGGEVAERLGDEVFCMFAGADDAAAAAAAMQQGVEATSERERLDRPMRIRIGFVHGPVVRSEEGYFGNTVHKAARLVALAKAGQILTTRGTWELLAPRWRRAGRYFDRRVLRGGAGEEEIHEILWDASFTQIRSAPAPGAVAGSTLAVELAYGAQRVRVDVAHPHAELGRDPACDLQLESSAVSRLHAAVDWNRGRVHLTDLSTNGTTVERTVGGAVLVHHETAVLEGEGVLRLGGTAAEEDACTVAYRCATEAG
ncbi:MAG: FHA domain-containing protein [Gammaproteobacteria bacterium]